jgi:hypothetical protein
LAGTVIKNRILTLFSSSGAEKTVGDVNKVTAATNNAATASENLTRNTTRLGQASASAGRTFSAQSKGMGGLVGTYAAAAATVFTLQQAFSALSSAARAETIVAGTNTLARDLSASGPAILKNLREITQGQLSMAEAATAANIALSAGFSTDQLNKMAEVAQKASRALGRDFEDALTRVTRGIAKMEPELLDELGIFVRIDPAVAAYARTLGKAANQLSAYERRQAFANATLEEGERKFAQIDTSSDSAQKSLEQLRVKVIELATSFGQILLPAATAIADFFTNKAGNSLILFAGLLSLVAGKGISLLSAKIGELGNSLNTMANNFAIAAARSKGSFAEIASAATQLQKTIDARGGISGKNAAGVALTREMSGMFSQTGVKADLAKQAADIRRTFLAGVELPPETMKKNIAVLEQVRGAVNNQSAAYRDASFIIDKYTEATKKAGWQSRIYTGIATTTTTVVKGLTLAFTGLQYAMMGLGLIIGGLSIFGWLTDTDPVGAIGNWIKGINALSRSLDTGLQAAVASTSGGMDTLIESFKALGATTSEIDALPDTIIDVMDRVQSAVDLTISDSENIGFITNLKDTIAQQESTLREVEREILAFTSSNQVVPDTLSDRLTIATENLITARQQLQDTVDVTNRSYGELVVSEIESQMAAYKAIIDNPAAMYSDIVEANKQYYILNQLLATTKELGINTRVVFADLANSTGLSATMVADVFRENILGAITSTEAALTVFGISVEKIGNNFSFIRMSEEARSLVDSFVAISDGVNNLNEDMASSNINLIAFSSSVAGLKDRLAQLVEEQKAASSTTQTTWQSMASTVQQQVIIDEIQQQIDKYDELISKLEQVEDVYKDITSVFASEIKLFDTADAQGLVSLTGQIATSQEEITSNQIDWLANVISLTAYTQNIAGDAAAIEQYLIGTGLAGEDLEIAIAKTNAEAELFTSAVDALAGKIFGLVLEAQKLAAEFDNATTNLQRDLTQLAAQRLELEIELEINEKQALADLQKIILESNKIRLETELSLIDAQENAGQISEIEAIEESNRVRQDILSIEIALENTRYANALDMLAMEEEQNRIRNDNAIAILESERLLLIADAEAKRGYIQAQADAIRGLATVFQQGGQNINDALAATLSNGAAALASSIISALTSQTIGNSNVTAGQVASINVPELETAIDTLNVSFDSLITTASEATQSQIDSIIDSEASANRVLDLRRAAEDELHQSAIDRLNTERTIEDLNTAGALANAADSSGGSGGDEIDVEEQTKKILDQYRELQDQYNSAFEDMKSAITDVISSITQLVSAAILAQSKARAEYMQVEEEFASFTVDRVVEELESVQDSLAESLEEEISLREDLRSITDELNESQAAYIESLSAQGAVIADSVGAYVDTLLKQKKAIVELNKTATKSQALGKQEATLAELQIQAQQDLESVTQSRMEAEASLENMEKLLAFSTDVLSNKFAELDATFKKLFETVQAFLGISAAASDAGISGMVSQIVGPVDSALRDFNDGLSELAKLQGESAAAAQAAAEQMGIVATTSTSVDDVAWYKNSTTLTTIGQGLAGAMTGFGVGTSMSALVGDTGWATTIGGTIGGAIAGTFAPAISGLFGTLASGVLGTMLNFAIPIVGSLIGSLIGSMFKKTPSAGASGTFGPDGYENTDMYAKGGASKETARNLDSIANQTLTGIVTGLEAVGISFVDTLTTTIKMTGDKISSATLQYADSTVKFTEKSLGKGQAGAEAAAAFYAESFFAGLRVERDAKGIITFRSLVVDAMTPNADDLQAAVDYFAELEDASAKTAEAFAKSIDFAQNFNDTLLSLSGSGTTTAQVFEAIETAADANAANLARYYTDLLNQTADTFGIASTQFVDAQEAVRENALAQIGLVEQVVNGTTELVAITDMAEDLNAGAILVNDIVTSIAAMGPALEAAGIVDIDSTITTGINASLETVLTDIGDGLEDAISLLTNPANSAVFAFEALLENNANRLAETEGALAEIENQISSGVDITAANLAQAEKNVELANTLNQMEIQAYLMGLSEAELMAIDSTMELDAATQALVDAQLEAIKAISEIKGLEILIDTSNDLYDSIGELTDAFVDLGYASQQLVGTTSSEFYELLGGTAEESAVGLDTLSKSLSQYTMNIASGIGISSSYDSALQELNDAYASGLINAEQYALGMAEVNGVTIEFIDILNDVYDQYVDTLTGILDMLAEARGEVQNSIEALGDAIIEGVKNYIDATQRILSIFDETLAGVAKSGNALFDLKDKATKSLNESTKALKEFEKENMLSGRSSAEVSAELAGVQQELANILSNPVDLTGFLKVSALTAQQTKLQNELNTLSEVEAEYQELLNDKSSAINDLAFVESTIIGLGDQLIDTRRTESDIIKEAQKAAVDFVKSQEALLNITEQLAAANFNLNQIRIDESDAVYRMTTALAEFAAASDFLEKNITDILGGDGGLAFIANLVETATSNTRQYYEQLGKSMSEVDALVAQAAIDATAYAQSLVSVSNSINAVLNPDLTQLNALPEQVQETLTYDQLIGTSLTNSFSEFNQDLIRYLDTDGMALFYGPGGVFSAFSNSLKNTLIVNGFDILTASGGPLENFNTYLLLTSQVISALTDDNATYKISVEAVTTSIGILVTALGVAEGGLTTGAAAIALNTDAAIEGIYQYTTAIGEFNVSVLGAGTEASIDILANAIPESINRFVLVVNAFNQTMNNLSISTVPTDISTSIVTEVNLFDSQLSSIIITGPNNLSGNFEATVNLFNSTVGAIIITGPEQLAGSFAAIINAFNSAVGSITITGINDFTNTFTVAITTFASTIGSVTINAASYLEDTFEEVVERINISINSIDLSPSAAYFRQEVYDSIINPKTAGSMANTIAAVNFSSSINSFNTQFATVINTLEKAFQGLLKVFTPDATSEVVKLTNALDKLNGIAVTINNTSGLNKELGLMNTQLNDSDAKVTAATSDFLALNKILKDMAGTDGSLDDIQAAMNTIVKDIETAWKNATAGGIKVPVTANPVTITPVLSSGDSQSLKDISRNTNRYPVISGADYGTPRSFYAEGGYVSGPGTSTSDSINAKLSNGEFVVKASSVKSIGLGMLNALNQTGDINDASRRAGRNGDSVVAHLNVREVEALAKSSQARKLSINPSTGFFEFFNADAGAIGSIFRTQEANKLYNTFKDKFRTEPVISDYELEGSSKPSTWSYHSLNWDNSKSPTQVTNTGSDHSYTADYFSRTPGGYSAMFEMLRGAGNLINTANHARELALLKRVQAGYATVTSKNGNKNYDYRADNSYLKLASTFTKNFADIGWGPGAGFGSSNFLGGTLGGDNVDMYSAQRGGYIAQPSQVMSAYLEMMNQSQINTGRNATPNLSTVQQFVDGMNKVNGNFTDFYMLTNGGLVGDEFTVGNGRDKTQALLEPGEFVLRKQAVDAMGLDNAIRLNSSGNVDSDIDIEVNIVNNGRPIETVTETQTRRENNKIIVDVVLDDIRTNGPITRQLRSIRR